MAEHPLDAVALTVKPLVVADRLGAVRFRWDDRANTALLEAVADCISVDLVMPALGHRLGNRILLLFMIVRLVCAEERSGFDACYNDR